MHLINFLLAIILPYIGLFNKFRPPDSIPIYFDSAEAAFIAGEFCSIVFYWAGFLRNSVLRGKITERQYFIIAFSVLVFMCISKIIFVLPYTWITSIFAFGLGVLSVSQGQGINKKSMFLMIILSVIILGYSTFILIGLAWFDFNKTDYYYYKIYIERAIERFFHSI